MLIRALGYGPIAGLAEDDPLPFRDVTTNKGHIAMAYELGLVSGMGNDLFRCRIGNATREQACCSCSAACMTNCTLLRTANEAMVLLRSGEEAEDLSGYQTVITHGGNADRRSEPPAGFECQQYRRNRSWKQQTASGQTVLLGISVSPAF